MRAPVCNDSGWVCVCVRIHTCASDMSDGVSRVCPSLGHGQVCLGACKCVFLSQQSPRWCESLLCLFGNCGCDETGGGVSCMGLCTSLSQSPP